MIEFDTVYRPGTRTYLYLMVRHGWWLLAGGAVFGYLACAMYFGSLHAGAVQFLTSHPDWFISVDMLAQWSFITSVAFFFVAFLRVSVLYRQYAFYVDEHAFHLRRGLIRIQEITIPYRQISNVHIEQPYHWRLFGLAKLDITISSSREALRIKKKRDFLIPTIDKPLAKALSHFLVKRASGEEDEEDLGYEEEDDGEDVEIEGNE